MTKFSNSSKEKSNYQEIDPIDLLLYFKKRIRILIVGMLIGGTLGWLVSSYLIHPRYSSFVDLYITNNTKLETEAVEYNDLNAAQKLVNTYMVILQSSTVTDEVLSKVNTDLIGDNLLNVTSFTSVQNTEVLRIQVETEDPQLTKDICDAYKDTASKALDEIVGAGSVKVISNPKYPSSPSYPSVPKFTAIGAFLGLVLMMAVCVLTMLTNNNINDEKELIERYSIPVLGTVPDFFQFAKALGISRKDVKKSQKLKTKNPENEKIMTMATVLNENTPFPIREAYNVIRSNILFSLTNMKNGIILVTSPNANDLKTTTSINMAISMAQIGAKVLLIDGDLRNASIYRYFKVSNQNGLSKVLMGFEEFEDAVVYDIAPGVDFLSSGPATPRPSELLGSSYMVEFLRQQALAYDFVIVDTSPINVVSDSLAMASVAAGLILVARENKTTFNDLDKAINSIQMANAEIIGFVLTDVDSENDGYGYGKKGYGYGYGYGEKKQSNA